MASIMIPDKGAIVITEEGKTSELIPNNGETFSLKELQEVVGGYIEIVAISAFPNKILVVDEEGRWRNKRPNLQATALVGREIVGQVLLIDKSQMN